MDTPFQVTVGRYVLDLVPHGLPMIYTTQSTQLLDEFQIKNNEGQACYVSVSKSERAKFLVVAQRYMRGLHPGVLMIPETDILFVGAGERLLAYDLVSVKRLWEDSAELGFWCWWRFDDYVLMSAELELAAWDIQGKKLWTTFVEPPWEFVVKDKIVYLDVMGKKSSFPIDVGLR